MQLKITKSVSSDVYAVKIETIDFSVYETSLLTAYGEPQVNVGGSFTMSSGNTYTVSSCSAEIKSGFPQTVEFDSRDSASAMLHAFDYIAQIRARFQAAMNELRANGDPNNFAGTESFSI